MLGRIAFSIGAGLFLVVGACSPQQAVAPKAPKPVAVVPDAPAKLGTMICRSSTDGRSVKCGAPNAVMVGMKFN